MLKVTKNGNIVSEYAYDPEGFRVVKKAKGQITHYVFQGTEPIFEKNITTGKVKSFVYALGKHLARVDGVIDTYDNLIANGVPVYFYHNDHVGSIRVVTDKEGKKVWSADYLAFGKRFGEEKNADYPDFEELHSFTGKEYDPDTGLHYYNARWYDADLGRFISEDPVADPNNPNLYSYTANNPLRWIDPTGLDFSDDWAEQDEADTENTSYFTPDEISSWGTSESADNFEPSGGTLGETVSSRGFWGTIVDFFTGRGRKSEEEMAAEFMRRHGNRLIDDLKDKFKDFDDWRNGSGSSGEFGLRGSFGRNYLVEAFARPFDINEYIYEDFGATLLTGALVACIVMGFSDPEDHLKAIRNGATAFAVVVGGLRTLPFLIDKNQQLANMIAQKYGGLIKPAAGNGWIIKIENITIRIMNSG